MEILTENSFDGEWSLFLDRDGTINRRIIDDYVKSISEFQFLPGALDAMVVFGSIFQHILVVTNQQGIGKDLMTHEDLKVVHDYMDVQVTEAGGRIDQIYYCPHLAIHDPSCRKPNPGMAIQAQGHFPDLNFRKSVMIGDSQSDIEFGARLGMYTVLVDEERKSVNYFGADCVVSSIKELSDHLIGVE